MNRLIHFLVFFSISLTASAEYEVRILPESPYLAGGSTNTFLVAIINTGTNSIPIPSGLLDDDGFVLPNEMAFTVDGHVYAVIANDLCEISKFNNYYNTGELLLEPVGKSITVEDYDKLYENKSLKPNEYAKYKINWVWNQPPLSESTETRLAMVSLKVTFTDYNIESPPISLYLNLNNSQNEKVSSTNSTETINASP